MKKIDFLTEYNEREIVDNVLENVNFVNTIRYDLYSCHMHQVSTSIIFVSKVHTLNPLDPKDFSKIKQIVINSVINN